MPRWPWTKKEKKESPGTPSTGHELSEVNQRWAELGIPLRDVGIVSAMMGANLDPAMVESLTYNLNRELANAGFSFEVSPLEFFGILVDKAGIDKHRKQNGGDLIPAIEVAIMRQAMAQIRKRSSMTPRDNMPQDWLGAEVEKMVREAENKIGHPKTKKG